ncbi:MAG: 5-formyltetrahydrofolate cyclo-ligase [Elusimicrobia bacterium RIFOXYA2_FULL_39_19]|nr:MAG: 5-formyltetrahydrofolate cyclo-ligase [Elusimicrobia bacterium RIFOXYA2_FULL_39_19]
MVLSIKKQKNDLRKKYTKIRNEIPFMERRQKDNKIAAKVLNSNEFKQAKKVMFFMSFRSEVSTLPMINKARKMKKTVVLPKVQTKPQKKMLSIIIKNMKNELVFGKYNILEPKSKDNVINPEEIDLVLVPGLAFDKTGRRIGYGGGYYDAFLKKVPFKKRIALAYSEQIAAKIPVTAKDLRMSKIITEKGALKCC